MALRIDESGLRAKLLEHKHQIGTAPRHACFLELLAGFFLLPTVCTLDAIWLKITYFLLAVVYIGIGAYNFRTAWKHPYSAEEMYKDIVDMDKPQINSSIIAVTDGTDSMSNRYLLYFDGSWDCWFFPNHRTADSFDNDVDAVRDYLSREFKIPASDFELRVVTTESRTKWSTEHNEERDYTYRLYKASVSSLPTEWQANAFKVGSKECRWMSIDEMLADPRINEVNSDVVSIVKQML